MSAHALSSMATSSVSSGKEFSDSLNKILLSIKQDDISDGRIQDTTGEVIYKVRF